MVSVKRAAAAILGAVAMLVSSVSTAHAAPEGWVKLATPNSSKCLDVAGWGQQDGAAVWQWTCGDSNAANQYWYFASVSDGIVEIVNLHSYKCLEVAGFSQQDGGDIQQWSCRNSNDANQQWRMVPDRDGYMRIINVNSGKCLDVAGWAQQDGARLQQWTCRYDANYRNQEWYQKWW